MAGAVFEPLTAAGGAVANRSDTFAMQLNTTLRHACKHGDAELAKRLLEQGANPNQTLGNGESILTEASFFGDASIVGVLLEHGANPNWQSARGWSALHSACTHAEEECVHLLVSFGAAQSLHSADGVSAIDILREESFRNQSKDFARIADWLDATRNWTPLHFCDDAKFALAPERTRALLRDGADPQAAPSPTPLDRARNIAATLPCPGASASIIVLHCDGWTLDRRQLMPHHARERAVLIGRIGCEVAMRLALRTCTGPSALIDPWMSITVPHLLRLEFGVDSEAY